MNQAICISAHPRDLQSGYHGLLFVVLLKHMEFPGFPYSRVHAISTNLRESNVSGEITYES